MNLLQSIHHYDVSLFSRVINARFHRPLSTICRYLSKTGDGSLYLLLAIVLYGLYGWDSFLLQSGLMALMIERPIYFVMKNSLKRRRPHAVLHNFKSSIIPSDQFSFPSGHTSAAFLMATLICYTSPSLSIWVLGWAGLVGLSRVVLGVHFPTDILMGMFLGVSIAIFTANFTITLPAL